MDRVWAVASWVAQARASPRIVRQPLNNVADTAARVRMTARTRILFVDDEPPVLTAIERQLRKDRGRWDMVFALGGQRGLDEVHKGCFTVVVSDLRMPNVDGVTLLNAIGEACPATVRIMLSGDAEAAAMSQAV